jgi:hypothetical protein
MLEDSAQLQPALAWSVDGRLFFAQRDAPTSDSSDTAIWSLRVNEESGEAEGTPVPVSRGVARIGELSVSSNGKTIAIRRANTQPEVFMSELDPSSHRLQAPRRFTLDENINLASTWTPDGRAVIMASNRSGNWKIFRQDLNQVTPEVLAEGTRNSMLPRLNSDGTAILYFTRSIPDDPQHVGEVVEVPLQGGPARSILRMPTLDNLQCARRDDIVRVADPPPPRLAPTSGARRSPAIKQPGRRRIVSVMACSIKGECQEKYFSLDRKLGKVS